MSIRRLVETFDAWHDLHQPLVLVTVVRTEGSTYAKAGRLMLFNGNGEFEGLVSGGCLEGDLAEHASQVLRTRSARVVTYDMRNRDEDEIWGLGLGCDGSISLLLTRLDEGNDYQPLAAIAGHVTKDIDAALGIVTDTTSTGVSLGASVVADSRSANVTGLNDSYVDTVASRCREILSQGGTALVREEVAGTEFDVLYHCIPLPPRILILGGGPDAPPLLRLADELGWRITIFDHRATYAAKMEALGIGEVYETRPEQVSRSVTLDQFDAAVVMSHHLQSDRAYLRELMGSTIPYIGILGPPARRKRLLEEMGDTATSLRDRVYGPIGLDIGADSPESIALAIVSQIHAVLKERTGTHLDQRPSGA